MAVRIVPLVEADVLPLQKVKVRPDQDRFVSPNLITIAQVRFDPSARDFTIWDDDQRVGLLALVDMAKYAHRDEMDDPDSVYIWRLLIGADRQGRGYGSAALRFAEDWARELGRSKVQVQAVEDNAAAIKLYQSLGYALTGLRDKDEVQLEKLV